MRQQVKSATSPVLQKMFANIAAEYDKLAEREDTIVR
jgi:hypothetical protein